MKGWLGGSLCTRLDESSRLIGNKFQVTLIYFLIRIVMTRHRLVQVIEKRSQPVPHNLPGLPGKYLIAFDLNKKII